MSQTIRNPLQPQIDAGPRARLPGTARDPLYPDSDGAPLGETEIHVEALILLREALQYHFRPKDAAQ